MDNQTIEILNWLDVLAEHFSSINDVYHKRLAEETIKIIMKPTAPMTADEVSKINKDEAIPV
jgi:hypothetical protein